MYSAGAEINGQIICILAKFILGSYSFIFYWNNYDVTEWRK